VDSGWRICRYCGHAIQELDSVADELAALEDLNRASMKLAQKGEGLDVFGQLSRNMMSQLGGGAPGRVARFWQNAFIPRTLEAQSQAMLQVFSQIMVPDGPLGSLQYALNTLAHKNQAVFLTRAETLLTAMRVQHAGEPVAEAKIAVLESEVEKAREKVRAARRRGWWVYATVLLGGLGLLGFMALVTQVFV